MDKYKITIVDDHQLVSNSLKKLVESYADFAVVKQLANGQQLISYLNESDVYPDVVLLDMKMPVMGGKKTITHLQEHYPDVKVLVLSMDSEERSILHMLKHGAKGYVLKDIQPADFKIALEEVIHKGFYHTEMVNNILLDEYRNPKEEKNPLTARETEFLKLACTQKTYKEIAKEMFLSPKTVDGYRENLFKKLGIKNRIGLAIYAIKHGIVEL